ncbi:MAG TPA: sulfotransferase family protein [Gammaproteobacteria bacterium]|nr:sulfotransferase family protein [Gammaproteobacteria bacterium]
MALDGEGLDAQARALCASGDFASALALYEQICEEEDSGVEAWLMQGVCNQKLGHGDRALSVYQEALKRHPDEPRLHVRAGRLLQKEGRLEEAERAWRRVLELRPDDVAALAALGNVLLGQGKPEDALPFYRDACAAEPADARLHLLLGCALRDLGRAREAVDSLTESVRLDPSNADAHFHRGLALQETGSLQEAGQSLDEAVRLYPDYAPYLLARAKLYQLSGNAHQALKLYQEATRFEPGNGNAWYERASLLYELGQLDEAVDSYRRAVQCQPRLARGHVGLAAALIALGRPAEAAASCAEVLRRHPGHADASALAAQVALRKGDRQEAYELLRPLLEQGVRSENVVMAFANVSRDVGRVGEAISLLEGILADSGGQNNESRVNLHFSLGRLYDGEQDYERAFHHFQQGNRLKGVSFSPEQHLMEVDAFVELNSWYFLNNLPRASIHSELPVFVIGMPRSGTTLVEQVLSSHPAVHGAGELTDMGELVEGLPRMLGTGKTFPHCLSLLTTEHLDRLARTYLGRLQALAPGAERVTDKMLGFMYLGLIDRMLPGARIIHCRRDPLDTCLSGYFQDFTSSHDYAYDLYNLGAYYRGYEKIMQNWKSILGIPMMEVRYEDMVADQEKVSRSLIEFCGLEWDDRCLRFHENERFVGTASFDQVRRPIYRSSVQRWKNYEPFLGPLRAGLAGEPASP